MQGRLPLVSFSPLDLWSLWFSSCCELTGGECWKRRGEECEGRNYGMGGRRIGWGGRVGGVEW